MRPSPNAILLAVTCLSMGALLGTTLPIASAQDATPIQPAPSTETFELLCKTFKVTPDDEYGGVFETTDSTDPIGQWVQEQEIAGWTPHSADLELGVKGTGFPIAYNQICLSRSK